MTGPILKQYFDALADFHPRQWSGRVTQVIGPLVESSGPPAQVGEACEIITNAGERLAGEVVGFRGSTVLSMTLERPHGLGFGDRVVGLGGRPMIPASEHLLGRVVDANSVPIDGLGSVPAERNMQLDLDAPKALMRSPIREPLGCGVRAIDGFLTCGRGQRMGIFGGSGVGKSTLLGIMARGTAADLTVLALVGERGREVREFLEDALGEEGRRRSVVVVSTSDESPLKRIRAVLTASAISEYFAASGRHVLLVVDSLTRFAMAQREIGLAAGEPPTAKGYTPSVFTLLARTVERAGNFDNGSITAFYTVLMEGDDQQDPIVDSVRSLLDGHIMLDRRLAAENHYPPIAILDSLSRLMSAVASSEHREQAGKLRQMLALYTRCEDLVRIGAYQKGADPELDRALAVLPALRGYLQQRAEERVSLDDSVRALMEIQQ